MSALTRSLGRAATRAAAAAHALGLKKGKPLMLLYHGVSAAPPAPDKFENCDRKHVPLDLFVQHLRVLKQRRKVISVRDMVEEAARGGDTNRNLRDTVAITFDDGYVNNLQAAAPALADFNMPATFFLATGYIGTGRSIWVDQIEIILGRTRAITLTDTKSGRIYPLTTRTQKLAALREVKSGLKKLPLPDIVAAVNEIGVQLGVTDITPEGDYRFMDWNEARRLGADFDLGAHTVNHPMLSRIPPAEAEKEILDSRDRIVAETGRCSETFCYPNGKPVDYSTAQVEFCRKHFKAALSTRPGPVLADEMFEIRRFGLDGGTGVQTLDKLLLLER